jgi:hypothetical protein
MHDLLVLHAYQACRDAWHHCPCLLQPYHIHASTNVSNFQTYITTTVYRFVTKLLVWLTVLLIRHTLISNPRLATAAVHISEIRKDWLIIMWFWELLWTAMNTIWGLKRMLPSPNKTIKHFWKCICIHLILIWSVDYIVASASSALLFISQDGSPQQKNKNTYVTYATI